MQQRGTPTVRRARDEDVAALCELSVAAIRGSATAHYDCAQVAAWAARRTLEGHRRLLKRTTTFVAVVDDEVAGFASVALEPAGELAAGEVDQLFVDPRHGGQGVARALLTAVATAARATGLTELVTHASWRAVATFERVGYRLVEIETVDLDGVALTRAFMRTTLEADLRADRD